MAERNEPAINYLFENGLASFLATYIAGILHPLDLIKTRFQSHDGHRQSENLVPKYQGTWNAIRSIYLAEGLNGLYKGFYLSLLGQASAGAFFFWIYEARKQHYLQKDTRFLSSVTIASTEAAILGTLLTQPIWMVKTRMVLNVNPGITEWQNIQETSREIIHQHGLQGYYKGLTLSLVLAFTGTIQMVSYEGFKLLYDSMKVPQTQLLEKNFFCGGASKLASVLMTYPLTTVRTRIQQDQYFQHKEGPKYKGIIQIFQKTSQNEGVRGFYKGMGPNLLRGVPYRGIYFYSYELLQRGFKSVSNRTY